MPRNIYGNSITQSAMIDKLRDDINIELANQIVSITNETEARINLESILSTQIIQEQVNRDSAISVETANRATAVDTLTTSISAETTEREYVSSLLNAAIVQERVNRVSDVDVLTTTIADSNIGNYVEETRTSATTIDSGSYVDINGMVLTPPAGTYKVHFSCWLENDEKKEDDGIEAGIYVDDVIIEHSKRRQWTGEAGKYETSVHTQAVVTVSGTQQIKARAYRLGGDRIRIRQRSLTAVCIASPI